MEHAGRNRSGASCLLDMAAIVSDISGKMYPENYALMDFVLRLLASDAMKANLLFLMTMGRKKAISWNALIAEVKLLETPLKIGSPESLFHQPITSFGVPKAIFL